jgi:hypothetical protein
VSGDGALWGFYDFNTFSLHGLLGMRLRSKETASPAEPPSTREELRALLEETITWAAELGYHAARMEHALAHADLDALLASLPGLWAGGGW